jgi:hypothetical protein
LDKHLSENELPALSRFFYIVKPLIPRDFQLFLRRIIARRKRKRIGAIWPIDPGAGQSPVGWKGWPNGKKFAVAFAHDVDTQFGHDRCKLLMDLEERMGVRSIFYIVPERYHIDKSLIKEIKSRGFGIGIHGLKHDGKLFQSYDIFRKSAVKINEYMRDWKTTYFSSPSMHHRMNWMHYLDMESSTSTFDTDPFEPQSDGIGTIFPFIVTNDENDRSFVEMPYTLPQDFTLYVILREKNIDIWKKKLDWIAQNSGLALINTHPDYMDFTNGKSPRREEYPVRFYEEFIMYLKNTFKEQYLAALPKDIVEFMKAPS